MPNPSPDALRFQAIKIVACTGVRRDAQDMSYYGKPAGDNPVEAIVYIDLVHGGLTRVACPRIDNSNFCLSSEIFVRDVPCCYVRSVTREDNQ